MHKNLKIQRGFTLVEFMLVLLMLGAVAMIAVANFSDWLDTYRLNKDSRAVASEMAQARFRAISGRTDISFTVGPGTGYSSTYQFSPGGQLKHLSRSVSISGVTGDNPLVFNSRGMASTDTTIHFVNSSGTTNSVNVTITGLIESTEGS